MSRRTETSVARGVALDRLDQLDIDDLLAVVSVVERTLIFGDGWLQRSADGSLRVRDNLGVIMEEVQ